MRVEWAEPFSAKRGGRRASAVAFAYRFWLPAGGWSLLPIASSRSLPNRSRRPGQRDLRKIDPAFGPMKLRDFKSPGSNCLQMLLDSLRVSLRKERHYDKHRPSQGLNPLHNTLVQHTSVSSIQDTAPPIRPHIGPALCFTILKQQRVTSEKVTTRRNLPACDSH